MRKTILIAITITSIFINLVSLAGQIRQLTWKDLVPEHLVSEDPLAKLDLEQQDLAYWVIHMLDYMPERTTDTEEDFKELEEAIFELKQQGVDVKKLMLKRKQIQTAVVDELNGKKVRIPGYLLPLDLRAETATEFLLVPYIGACIHVPPPPPNQIIHVKTTSNRGYKSKGLYDPVWVTGTLKIEKLTKDLYLVDGSAGINIGYSIQVKEIEPYKN